MFEKIAHWLAGSDVGVSSKTMAIIAMGATAGHFDAPYDGADFGRCYRLVNSIPEIKNYFDRIARAVPRFAGILRNWDTLVRIYERDAPTGRSDDLYEAIQFWRNPENASKQRPKIEKIVKERKAKQAEKEMKA